MREAAYGNEVSRWRVSGAKLVRNVVKRWAVTQTGTLLVSQLTCVLARPKIHVELYLPSLYWAQGRP